MKKNRYTVRVLIVGVGGGSHGLEIMKALRSSKLSYFICAADMVRQSLGMYGADKKYIVPSSYDRRFIPRVLDICKRDRIQAVFHGCEPALQVLSDDRAIFEKEGIFLPFNSQEVINLCLNKSETFRLLDAQGIPVPKTLRIENEREIDALDFFPVIVKPYMHSGGSRHTYIAQDKEELIFFFRYILKYGGKALVQEYIGDGDNEYTVGILSDKAGKIISAVAVKRLLLSGLSNRNTVPSLKQKNRVLAISSGISQGKIINNKQLFSQCKKIARSLDSRGPLNIQCRFVSNTAYPFEINPRFSGTTFIRALAGVNEPDLLIRKYVLRQRIPERIVARPGLALRGLHELFIPGEY